MSPITHFRRGGRGPLADERGVALVEFALVLPILLLILFAIIDVGKAVSYWNDQTHLAGEAARYAAVNKNPGPGSSLESTIKNQAVTSELKSGSGGSEGVQGSGVQVTICFPNIVAGVPQHSAGDPVRVTVRSTYNWLSFLGGAASTTMTATSTMRLEQPWDGTQYDIGAVPTGC